MRTNLRVIFNMHANDVRGERHVCWPRMGERD